MKDNMIRLQFEATPESVREIEKLMEICELTTKRELFNNALTLLRWAVDERQEGNDITSINRSNKTIKELHMPILAAAARCREPA